MHGCIFNSINDMGMLYVFVENTNTVYDKKLGKAQKLEIYNDLQDFLNIRRFLKQIFC